MTLCVRDLLNRFLTSKKLLVDGGEITPRTCGDYHLTCERIKGAFGLTRPVLDLAADDFETMRASMAKTLGPVALAMKSSASAWSSTTPSTMA
jgi:hypothetical protein